MLSKMTFILCESSRSELVCCAQKIILCNAPKGDSRLCTRFDLFSLWVKPELRLGNYASRPFSGLIGINRLDRAERHAALL